MDYAKAVAAQARRGASETEFLAYVVSVDDATGKVALDTGHEAACASGYLARAVGDLVMVKRLGQNARQFVVMDRVGAEWQQQEVPPIPAVGAGTALPSGTGWSEVTKVFAADGGQRLYFQTAGSVTPDTSGDPASIASGTLAVYRDGTRREADGPMQGDWGYGDHSTVWLHPNLAASVAARGAGAVVTVKLTRRGGIGYYNPTSVRLRMHAHTAIPARPAWVSPVYEIGTLTCTGNTGETKQLALPDPCVEMLRSGAATGIGIEGTTPDQYMSLAASASGHITVT